MSIKTLLCQLVCIGCLLLLPAICLAQQNDVSALLKQAEQLEDDDQYDQAEAIYKQILKDYPGTDDALEAQKLLTISHIHRGSRDEAELALQELLAKFSENEHIAKTVDDIADEYRESKDYDKARQLYQHVVGNWPDADYAPESQRGLILLDILAGDEGAAQTDIDKLLTEFSGRKDIAKVAAHVADDYRDLGKYESALELYRYVVETWPDSEYAMGSVVSIAGLNIELGNETAAQAALDKLIADFPGNKGLARAVDHVADTYRDCRKYDKAKELYKYVADTWPQAEHALDSQTSLAKLYIRLGDDPNIQAAIDKLLAEFSQHNDIADVVDEIADEYRRHGKYAKALALNKLVVEKWPDSEQAIQSQVSIARLHITRGDDPNAEKSIDKLLLEFAEHPELTAEIREIAESYENVGSYEQAKDIYSEIIFQSPNSADARRAELDNAKVDILKLIDSGDDPNVQVKLDDLIADFNDHKDLAKTVFQIGEKFYSNTNIYRRKGLEVEELDSFTQAKNTWDRIITDFPETDVTPAAYFFSGYCCRFLGEYDRAVECYEKVASDWPDYKHAGTSHFLAARCYEQLYKTGKISREQAAPPIRQWCQQLLANYSDCPMAKAAKVYLKDWKQISNEGEEK